MNNSKMIHSEEPIKIIFICNKDGKAVSMLAPNHIGRTVPELLAEAQRQARQIGGHIEVASRFGGPTRKIPANP